MGVALLAGVLYGADGTPPAIEGDVGGPAALAGDVPVEVSVTDGWTGLLSVVWTLDGEQIDPPSGALRGLPDGPHELSVTARDRRFNTSAQTWTFVTDNTPPALTVARSSLAGAQGRTTMLHVRASEPLATLSLEALGGVRALRPVDDARRQWRLPLGLAPDLEAGSKAVAFVAADVAGNPVREEREFLVAATEFPRGGMINLTPAQVEARKNRPGVDAANRRRREAYATAVEGGDRWDGPFSMPVDGVLSSPFGKVRNYSDGKVSRHLGTDFAAPTGTDVVAPAGAVVVLSEEMSIYGQVVILKHGPDVSSSFNHLSEMLVKPGDVVARGDLVGRVGSTGQSTGPHLHWGMVVGGVAVAAEQWAEPGFGEPAPGDFD